MNVLLAFIYRIINVKIVGPIAKFAIQDNFACSVSLVISLTKKENASNVPQLVLTAHWKVIINVIAEWVIFLTMIFASNAPEIVYLAFHNQYVFNAKKSSS